MEGVVGEENVGCAVFREEINNIVREISHIDDDNLVKRAKQIPWQSVSVAVLEYRELSAGSRVCLNLNNLRIAAHKRAVSHTVSVAVMNEEIAVELGSCADNSAAAELVFIVGGRVLDGFRDVVHKVLGVVFEDDVLGVAIHRAHIIVNNLLVVLRDVQKRHARGLCKLLRCVIG